MVEVLLLDLDETLIPDRAATLKAIIDTGSAIAGDCSLELHQFARDLLRFARELWQASPLHAYAYAIGISSWEGLWAGFSGEVPEVKALRDWAPAYRYTAWNRALLAQHCDSPDLADNLATSYPERRRAQVVPFPEVDGVLTELRQTYPLALITNGVSDLQREKLGLSGLEHYFDFVLVSGECGAGKPDPRIFQRALHHFRVPPPAAVMVGDSLERDIAGAYAAGCRPIWINRLGAVPPAGSAPMPAIATLSELPLVLAQAGPSRSEKSITRSR